MGVLGVDLILSQINSFLNTIKISPSAKIFILERNGLLVAQSGTDKPYRLLYGKPQRIQVSDSSDELVRAANQYLTQSFGNLGTIQKSQLLNFDLNGKQQFVQVTPWKDTLGLDWLIVVVVPESDFMGQISENTRNTLWLCLAALVATISVGILTARWITLPILRVTKASEDIANGNLDQHIQSNRIVELEKLAIAFNSMAKQLKTSFENLETKNANLHQTEERNRAFLNAIPDLILRINRDGIYLDAVDAKGVNTVVSKQERIGKRVYDVLPIELAQEYMRFIERALATGETQIFEYQLTIQNKPNDFEARVVASGVDEVIFIVRDITQRKQTESALQLSEATSRALISAIPDLLMRVRGDGTYLDIAGRDRLTIHDEFHLLSGSKVHDSLPFKLAEQRMNYIQTALKTGKMQVYEQRLRAKGQLHEEEVRIIVCGDNEVLVMVRDITDRKQAEEALRIAEENYRSIFENTLEGIFQSSHDGYFINVNPAMARLYGYNTPEEMIASVTQIDTQTYVNLKAGRNSNA